MVQRAIKHKVELIFNININSPGAVKLHCHRGSSLLSFCLFFLFLFRAKDSVGLTSAQHCNDDYIASAKTFHAVEVKNLEVRWSKTCSYNCSSRTKLSPLTVEPKRKPRDKRLIFLHSHCQFIWKRTQLSRFSTLAHIGSWFSFCLHFLVFRELKPLLQSIMGNLHFVTARGLATANT